ncbi:MAG: HAMP domain-containing protein [Chloroflexi bacterium]|nr:HAMP domain-containing protein [Chloroflexota bacterium]
MSDIPPTPQERRRSRRFFSFVFLLLAILLFIGGTAALLYWLFSEYSGIRNIWLIACGAPFVFVVVAVIIIFNLYNRFGRPLEKMFNAIDAVAEGDLSVRVPENTSGMFSDLNKRFNNMIAELERAEQQRRNLTADIAHELRTPLHIIQGNLEGVLDGVYQPTSEHINNTLSETRLLTRLVNDLQILSLAETGQLPLHPTRFLLADLLHDLAASFSSEAATLGIELKTSLTDPRQEIMADYDRLQQVLSNLVSNALRHTPAGGKVAIETEPASSAEKSTRIVVWDSGQGIAPADLPFIFDRFWRGDKSRRDRTHSGLGLAIAKQIIHAHGGKIEAKSVAGSGSSFMIELPKQLQSAIKEYSQE